jgi:Transglutaminase-like superfamily
MWKAFQRYSKLDPEAKKLFWRAALLLPCVRVSLRLRGFQRTRDDLQQKLRDVPPQGARTNESTAARVEKISRMAKTAAHYGIGHATCLEQSLVLWFLLRQRDIPARLRIGVKKQSGKFEAHAWVEHDGIALNQPEEVHRHYAAFESEFSDVSGENA